MQGKRLNRLQERFFAAIKNDSDSILVDIIPASKLSPSDCVQIYSRGYAARLTEALGETFEATWWVLGDEDFFSLCQQYIQGTPSFHYDLSDYGTDFPDFLVKQSQAVEISFIAELAKFELLFKEIFHKGDVMSQAVDWSSVVTLNDNFKLKLSPSASLVASQFPIYTIWKNRAEALDCMSEIDLSKSENLLMYKQNSQVFVRSLENDEFILMLAFAEQKTLGDALERLLLKKPETTPERIQEIFSTIAQLGVFSPVDSMDEQ